MSATAQTKLKTLLPFASPRNPVDITAQAFNNLELVSANLDVMLEEKTYDSIVAFFTFVAAAKTMVGPISETLRLAKEAHPECLLVLSIVGPREIISRYEESGCPVFEDPTRAVRAVDALSRFSEAFARRAPSMPIAGQSDARLPPAPISEVVAKKLLSDAGLPMVDERVCATADEAAAAAIELGLPVALKIASPDIVHKTEFGGVELALNTTTDVKNAFASVTGRTKMAHPEARLEGVLVSPMVTGGVETIFGVQDDPTFGPVIMFGLGGVFVETLKDVSFRVAPFDDEEAHRMMRELQGFAVLNGVRGRPRCDLAAIASALAALSRFAAEHSGQLAFLRTIISNLRLSRSLATTRCMKSVKTGPL